jgi:hypothetical protein
LQDDLKRFVSEPQPPLRESRFQREEKPRPRNGRKSAKEMTLSS